MTHRPVWTWLGDWLARTLAQMSLELALLAVLVAALVLVVRIRRPAVRHRFWCLLLAKPFLGVLIASPLSMYWFVQVPRPMSIHSAASQAQAWESTADNEPGIESSRREEGDALWAQATPAEEGRWHVTPLQIVCAAWALVAGTLLLRLGTGMAFLARLRSQGRPGHSAKLEAAMQQARDMVPARWTRARVAISDTVREPVLTGIFRPVILLPGKLVDALGTGRLRLILAHELAHVRRMDNLVLLVQRLAEALLFFHPVTWLCGRMLQREAEAACDEQVVKACGDGSSYADTLAYVAEYCAAQRGRAGWALLSRPFSPAHSSLFRRVDWILQGKAGSATKASGMLWLALLAVIGFAGLPSAGGKAESANDPATQDAQGLAELGFNAPLGDRPVFPADNAWNLDVSREPCDPASDAIIASIGPEKSLHPDFGAQAGISYVVVGGGQPRANVEFAYPDQSDPGPYPVPRDAAPEAGTGAGDHYTVMIDRDNWVLYEAFCGEWQKDGSLKAHSGAVFDLKSNKLRPAGWTSADAAGLPILPGLVRGEEVFDRKEIRHALRFAAGTTRRAYVAPATHWASSSFDPNLPPMGMRVRLKAGVDISSFAPPMQVILKALKTHGMILADNGGDWYIAGSPDARHDASLLGSLKKIKGKDFEVIRMNDMRVDTPRTK